MCCLYFVGIENLLKYIKYFNNCNNIFLLNDLEFLKNGLCIVLLKIV